MGPRKCRTKAWTCSVGPFGVLVNASCDPKNEAELRVTNKTKNIFSDKLEETHKCAHLAVIKYDSQGISIHAKERAQTTSYATTQSHASTNQDLNVRQTYLVQSSCNKA